MPLENILDNEKRISRIAVITIVLLTTPLYIPKAVKECGKYSDISAEKLSRAVSDMLHLEKNLQEMGLQIFPGNADFILLYTKYSLYNKLLEHGAVKISKDYQKGFTELRLRAEKRMKG